MPKSNVIKNNNAHIAQGLKPSNKPIITVKSGKEKVLGLISPKIGILILLVLIVSVVLVCTNPLVCNFCSIIWIISFPVVLSDR